MTIETDSSSRDVPVAACDDARRDLSTRGELLATISHEIRTGLNGVIGLTALLKETELSAEQRRYTQMLGAASEALLAVVNDVLELSQLEAGRFEPDVEDVRLFDLIEEVLQAAAPEAYLKGLHLALVPEPDVCEIVRGDPRVVRRLLTNLVANGVKFTDAGQVSVHVGRAAGPGPGLRFIVADTGCGIPDAQRPKLFQPFSRVRQPGEPARPGSGLGLAICAKLVELLGGAIGVDGGSGAGSRFWFTLPTACTGGEVPESASTTSASEALRGQRVLVASSREALCASIGAFAARWGMTCASVADFAVCASRAGREPGTIVLLDASGNRDEALALSAELVRLRCQPVLMVPVGWSAVDPGCPVIVLPLRRAALHAALLVARDQDRADAGARDGSLSATTSTASTTSAPARTRRPPV